MTGWRIVRFLTAALLFVVLTVSGAYLIVYLYRWEWNRAQVSGLFFVAALVITSTALVLRAIRRLEDRVGTPDASPAGTFRATISTENRSMPAHRFDWLREPPDRTSVFVPVLLGAGVILSFVAYVLEHLAGWAAGPSGDRRTMDLLAPDLPLGVPLREPVPARPPAHGGVRRPAARGLIGWVLAGVVALGSIVAAVDVIADATQSRPERVVDGGRHLLLVRLEQRGAPRPVDLLAEALTVACQQRLPEGVRIERIEPLDDDHVIVVVDHRLGELADRRYVGCLEDATVDLVQADVER